MRIGILTLPLHTNYGGILQAYALQTILEIMGHQVVVFNKKIKYSLSLWRLPLSFTKRIIKKYIIGRKDTRIFAELYQKRDFPIIAQHTQYFINQYINTYKVDSFSTLKEVDFDALVVGSDQVWRFKYFVSMFGEGIENAFLLFAKDWRTRKIAYAASFGVDIWELSKKQTRECKELIKKFDFISVREDSAVDLCKRYLGVDNVEHVLDPTLLLKKEDYIDLVLQENEPVSGGNLFYYLLDKNEQKMSAVEKTAQFLNLNPFTVMPIDNRSRNIEDRVYPTVTKWLRGFMDAKFVVTDSFHGVVFSILFNIPFVVISNETRGSARFLSVLKMFSLENRLINNSDDLNKISSSPINWDFVNNVHEQLKEKSYNLLNSNLIPQ
mgnify:CR=1 FL=1